MHKMTSSQMLCFLQIVTLLIGDFVPVDDIYWQLLIRLRNLIEIIFSKIIHKNTWIYLKDVIQ